MGQTSSTVAAAAPPASCPMPQSASAPAKCPVEHNPAAAAAASDRPARCPVEHAPADALNPANQMPALAQTPVSSAQSAALPTQRVISSIPRPATPAEEGERWEYPSPQQFYNALVRKGWETPEEHVETMVEIHNFLNEQAWEEVLKWERRREGTASSAADVRLARFQGRPGELSPKARFWLFAGLLLPSRFNAEPPFDRHDWVVRRNDGEEVRYVIDYYGAPPEPDGSPVFSLDVRPALDSFGSVKERIAAATEDVWAALRESKQEAHPRRET